MQTKKNILTLMFTICLFLTYSYADQVQVFSQYDTTFEIFSNNTLKVEKDLKIKNTHTVGIIPGEMEFQVGNKNKNFIVASVKAYDNFDNELKTKVVEYNNYSKIEVNVEYPILPGFEYDFKVEYILEFDKSGIFFKTLEIPKDESSIKIENKNVKINLPQGYSLTYANENYSTGEKNEIILQDFKDDNHSILIEYSYIPIKVEGFRGMYIFWISLNSLLILLLLFLIRRAIQKYLDEEEEEEIIYHQNPEHTSPYQNQSNHQHQFEDNYFEDEEEFIDEELFK